MFSAWWSSEGGKTFRPRQGHKPGSTMYKLHMHAEKTLGAGNLREAVALPERVDENEWIATKTIDLFNEVEMVHQMVAEFCTESACPVQHAGPCRRVEIHKCCDMLRAVVVVSVLVVIGEGDVV